MEHDLYIIDLLARIKFLEALAEHLMVQGWGDGFSSGELDEWQHTYETSGEF